MWSDGTRRQSGQWWNMIRLVEHMPTASCVGTRMAVGACLGSCCCGDERFFDGFRELWHRPIASCAWSGDLLDDCSCTRCCPGHATETCYCMAEDIFDACNSDDRIVVTQDDINAGKPRVPSSCPIALAVRRQYPEVEAVKVGPNEGIIVTGPNCRTITTELLDDERDWVRRFDRGEKVVPFELKASIKITSRASEDEWAVIEDWMYKYGDDSYSGVSEDDDRDV